MDAQISTQIVILGKTGSGKSSLANTILREDVFPISHAASSEDTMRCAETKSVDGKLLTLIETPGLIGTCGSEEFFKRALIRCITECAPGPHAFLIALKVERYTVQEQEIIRKIGQYFSEEAFSFAAVVFTHGDQLPDGATIQEFVSQNEELRKLVQKCGGRCHVVDNKYWKTAGRDEYRSNDLQVGRLLSTIESIIKANNNGFYSNEMFREVMKELEKEEDEIRKTAMTGTSQLQIRTKARGNVFDGLTIRLAGTAAGALMGAFLGVAKEVKLVLLNFDNMSSLSVGAVTAAAQAGAVRGAMAGYEASGGAASPMEAVEKVWDALRNQ